MGLLGAQQMEGTLWGAGGGKAGAARSVVQTPWSPPVVSGLGNLPFPAEVGGRELSLRLTFLKSCLHLQIPLFPHGIFGVPAGTLRQGSQVWLF